MVNMDFLQIILVIFMTGALGAVIIGDVTRQLIIN
jgi:hypothetical protein